MAQGQPAPSAYQIIIENNYGFQLEDSGEYFLICDSCYIEDEMVMACEECDKCYCNECDFGWYDPANDSYVCEECDNIKNNIFK